MAGGGDDDVRDTALSDTVSADDGAKAPGPDTLRSAPVKPGDKVGRYVVVQRLGAGGMGSVYRARDPELGREIAIKLLHPHLADQRARLLREGQAIARLAHRNVVAIHDVGSYRDGLFIAMELVAGTTLRGWLAGAVRPIPQIFDVFAQAGAGLAAAHAATIVHRDFKPDNVLVGDDGRVVVTDFGLARAFDAHAPAPGESGAPVDATQTGAWTGTPLYMSPEQFTGGAIGAASDQFSFCVALYEAVYRERPFRGVTVAAIMEAVTEHPPKPQPASPAIPAPVRDAILRGLARDPAARHPSMAALLAALAPPPRSHRRKLAIAIGALALAGCALATYALTHPAAPAAAPTVAPALDACAAAGLRVHELWTPAIRADAAKSLGARDTAAGDLARVDRYVARWQTLREAACRAPQPGVAAGPCLDHQLTQLEALPKSWASDSTTLGHWPAIPDPDRCTRPRGEVVSEPLRDSIRLTDAFEIDPAGTRYAVVDGGVLRTSELATGTQHTYPVPAGWSLAGFRDSTHLVFVAGRQVRILDETAGTWRDEPPLPADFQVTASAPGWAELVGTSPRGLTVLVRATGAEEVLAPPDEVGEILAAALSPDGRRLATVQGKRAEDAGNVALVVYERARDAGRPAAVVRQRLRALENLEDLYELAWTDDAHLVLEARIDDRHGGDLWELGGASLAAFAQPPTLALRAPVNTSYVDLERSGDHLMGLEVAVTKALARVVDGRATTLPGTEGLRISDVTRDGKHLLVSVDGVALALATADGTRTQLGHGLAFAHGDRIATYTSCEGGALCIVERDPAALRGKPAAVTAIAGFPKDMACSGGACIELTADEALGQTRVRPLLPDDSFGPPRTLSPIERPRESDTRPSPDGKRVAVVRPYGTPPEVDVFPLDRPGPGARWLAGDVPCHPTRAYWRDATTLAIAEGCDGHAQVVEVKLGGPPRVVYETPNIIDDLVVAADGTLFLAERSYVSKVVALTGF